MHIIYSNTGATIITVPTRKGYDFGGFYSLQNGKGTKYINETGESLNVSKNTFTSDKTFFAYWKPHTYTISYLDTTGASGSTASSVHAYDVAKNLTSNGFVKTGYTFVGWSTTNGGNKVYNNSQSVTNLTDANGSTIPLYAVWSENAYYISFNGNGATRSVIINNILKSN